MFNLTFNMAVNLLSPLSTEVNNDLEGYSPTQIILLTLAASLIIKESYSIYTHWDTKEIIDNLKNGIVKTCWKMPVIGPTVDKFIRKQVSKELTSFKRKHDQSEDTNCPLIYELPENGMEEDEIKKLFADLDTDLKDGRLSGAIYTKPTQKNLDLLNYVIPKTAFINPMHATAWPKIKKMEAAVVSICKKLFNAPPDTFAHLTYGGTYSILEACKAITDHARQWKVAKSEKPEIIVPTSAHAAFDKAAKMYNAKLIKVPVGLDGKADVAAMEAAITKNTCMMVGSFSFMYGVFDPIEELGKVAEKNNIFFHVDACLGGFEIPFAKAAGQKIPVCDLSIPTIDTYSADFHKFGETIKGTSILFIRQKKTFSPNDTYTQLEWPGGAYVTQGMGGSGTGLFIAAAYATLLSMGANGYIENQKQTYALRDRFVEEITKIEGLEIPYSPELSVIGIRTKPGFNAHVVIEKMQEKGWHLNTINTIDCKPEGFHFCVTPYHTTVENLVEDFSNDLRAVMDELKRNPNLKPSGEAKVYGTLSAGWVPHIVQDLIGNLYQRILNSAPGEKIPGFFDEAKLSTTRHPAAPEYFSPESAGSTKPKAP